MIGYFAAANTGEGFVSLFPSCFSARDHRAVYVLKGGPGTGKSTLMRHVACASEAFGYETEVFYCASDPSSLDGVRIPSLGVCVVDGTPPHTVEPRLAGVSERLTDLGAAFDTVALYEKREELFALADAKAEAYRAAYRYLAAAGRMAAERDSALSSVFLEEKARAAAERLVSSLKHARPGPAVFRYLSAITSQGEVHLDTLRCRAEKRFAVTNKNGMGYLFMAALRRALLARGLAVTICETPLTRDRTEEIFVEGERLLVYVASGEETCDADRIVNAARFFPRNGLTACRARVRGAEKCEASLVRGAVEALSAVGRLHARMEAIYSAHTDFDEVDRVRGRILSEIFANNM